MRSTCTEKTYIMAFYKLITQCNCIWLRRVLYGQMESIMFSGWHRHELSTCVLSCSHTVTYGNLNTPIRQQCRLGTLPHAITRTSISCLAPKDPRVFRLCSLVALKKILVTNTCHKQKQERFSTTHMSCLGPMWISVYTKCDIGINHNFVVLLDLIYRNPPRR